MHISVEVRISSFIDSLIFFRPFMEGPMDYTNFQTLTAHFPTNDSKLQAKILSQAP